MIENERASAVYLADRTGEVRDLTGGGMAVGSDDGEDLGSLLAEPCPFTNRQIEMIQWLANGKTASEIGCILGLSLWTVQKYLDRAKQAAGVRKDTALVAMALRNGWIA